MQPDHFYVATWKEVTFSWTTDIEPQYEAVYDIRSGPYATVMDAWESAILTDEEWDDAVVLGFKGVEACHVYHEIMSDEPTEDALHHENARQALIEAVSG